MQLKLYKKSINGVLKRISYSFIHKYSKQIYECDNERCPRPGRYRSASSNKQDVFPCDRPGCGGQFRLIRHISFVDCPGHETFMAAMLNGTAVMDAALLIIGKKKEL